MKRLIILILVCLSFLACKGEKKSSKATNYVEINKEYTSPSGKRIFTMEIADDYYFKLQKGFRLYRAPGEQASLCNDERIVIIEESSEHEGWFYIMTERGKFGWIDMEELKDSYIDSYYEDISDEKNYRQSLKREELKIDKRVYERAGPFLKVKLEGEESLYVDTFEKSYNLLKILSNGYYLLNSSGFEYNRYFIYKAGRHEHSAELRSVPYFSPDNLRFFTIEEDYSNEAPGVYYMVKLFRVEGNQIVPEFSRSLEESIYRIRGEKWLDNSHFEFRVVTDISPEGEPTTVKKVKYDGLSNKLVIIEEK